MRTRYALISLVTYLVIVVAVALACAGLVLTDPPTAPVTTTGAVCGSDASCAAWEVLNRIPLAQRCYGAPCPANQPIGRQP